MKPFTEYEQNVSNKENDGNDKIIRKKIEQIASVCNHQDRFEHIDKTVSQFNAMLARLNASKNGEK